MKIETDQLIMMKDTLEIYMDTPYQTFGKPIHSFFRNVERKKKKKVLGFSQDVNNVSMFDELIALGNEGCKACSC